MKGQEHLEVDHRDTVDKTSVSVILRDAWGRQMLKKYFKNILYHIKLSVLKERQSLSRSHSTFIKRG